MKKDWDNANPDDKEKMEGEAREALKEEGLSDKEVNKAMDMFKKNDIDGLMKMKREMEGKGGKGKGGKGEGKGDKKLATKPKKPVPGKLVTLSEEKDESEERNDMEKAREEYENASPEDKKKMEEMSREALKKEGLKDDEVD